MFVCLFPNSSQTNGRNYFKFGGKLDGIPGSAQKFFGDLRSKVKVTRGQKVNNGYNCLYPCFAQLDVACSKSFSFRNPLIVKFCVFSNNFTNMNRTETYNLSLERELNNRCYENNEISKFKKYQRLKCPKLNFGKMGCE